MQSCKSIRLFEIDQPIKNCDNIVDAENEGIEYACRAKLQSAM